MPNNSHDKSKGSMWQRPLWAGCIAVVLTLTGCGRSINISVVTSGFHAPGETFLFGQVVNGRLMPSKPETVVIWANHVGVEPYLAGELLNHGYTVVERARLQQIFDEQKIRLMYTPDKEADILRVGQLAGATQLIFVEARREQTDGNESRSVSVGIRSVSVETGQVRWSGTTDVIAKDGYVVRNGLEGGRPAALAVIAMRRATCLVETGRFEWIEPSESDLVGGCRQRRP
jgi:hypothetical protein